MGLFEEVENLVAGSSGTHSALIEGVVQMLNSQQGGGLSGLLQTFQGQGLGHLMDSWVGNGTNLPISSEQIQQVLGSDKIQQLAAKAGISSETAKAKLAQLPPGVVDTRTPDGQISEGSLLGNLASLLKGRAQGQ